MKKFFLLMLLVGNIALTFAQNDTVIYMANHPDYTRVCLNQFDRVLVYGAENCQDYLWTIRLNSGYEQHPEGNPIVITGTFDDRYSIEYNGCGLWWDFNLYFTDDGKQLLGNSDTVLMEYVMLFMNHPEVSFLIKGYVPTYGDVTMESDQEVSLERALTVKNFLISKGIASDRMTVAGMTPNEIRRAGTAANDPKIGLLKKRIEFIVTGTGK